MKIDAIIKDIQKQIAIANKIESIEELISINLRLAGYLPFLAETENTLHLGYLNAYNERKYQTAVFIQNGNGSHADRLNKAEIDIKDYRDAESTLENQYEFIRGQRDSLKKFIDVLTQKISYLKKEKESNGVI